MLTGAAFAALAAPVQVSATPSPIDTYVRARAAASAGAMDQASADFAAALDAAPGNELVASQAFSHGIAAGDWALAHRAATILERKAALLPDARFLLLGEALRGRDWAAAERQIEAIEREEIFGFAVPILRAWLAQGSGQGDPLAALGTPAPGAPASYTAEHRALLLVAMGRPEAAPALIEQAAISGPRGVRMRIGGAAALAARGEREAALALLAGEDTALRNARRLVEAGRPIPGAIDDPADGVAELLVRLGLDLYAQQLAPLGTGFLRIATRLAPENAQARLIAAEMVAERSGEGEAVRLLTGISEEDPFADAAVDLRVRLLLADDEEAAAIAAARSAAEAPSARVADWARLGDALVSSGRHSEAAEAFARALDVRQESDSNFPEWGLWLMRGGALEQADRWPEAKRALERAYALAPDQPFVLNYLGYAQLERRENLVEAERLVREAHRLAPDNAAITDSLGWALFLKGDVTGAIPLLERAAEAEPADPEINEHLGDAYYAAGRRNDARFAWRAALVYAEPDDEPRLRAKLETGLTPRLAAR